MTLPRSKAHPRLGALLMLILASASAAAGQNIWSHVPTKFGTAETPPATLSQSEQTAIRGLLRAHRKSIGWECGGDQLTELLSALTFETIALSDTHRVFLVEAGAGCARGGQGSNGAMWLVRFDGETPVLMASPRDGFDGWLFAIPESSSHGYRDVVLGWSMGAGEGGLNYFRFDGNSYHAVGSASYTVDDDDNVKIVPNDSK